MEHEVAVHGACNEQEIEPPAYMRSWWRWIEHWLAMPLPAGMKALVIRHFVVVATGLNKAMRSMVHDNAFAADILQLLKKTMQDPEDRQLGSTIAI